MALAAVKGKLAALAGVQDLNETFLNQYNLVFYDTNRTLSNDTICYYLPADEGRPSWTLFPNGTILPTPKSCSDPVQPVRLHGILGIVFGCLYVMVLITIFVNLQRTTHRERQTRVKGATGRPQYYFALLSTIIGIVVSFVAIDVDREVVPGLPFKLQCVFNSLEPPFVFASVLEAVLFWIPYSGHAHMLSGEDHTSWTMTEKWWNVMFYVLDAAGLGLVVIRDWDDLLKQTYSEEVVNVAKPAGTDARMKTGYSIMLAGIVLIGVRLLYGWRQYATLTSRQHTSNLLLKLIQLTIMVGLSFWIAVYYVCSSILWEISPYNAGASQASYYVGNVLPAVLILICLSVAGITESYNTSGLTGRIAKRRVPIDANNSKPRWWRNSKYNKFDGDTKPLSLDFLRTVRGKSENYNRSNGHWWWQKIEEQDDNVTQGASTDPGLLEPKSQINHQFPASQLTVDSSNSGGRIPSSAANPAARHRSQQRQGPVKSLLDV